MKMNGIERVTRPLTWFMTLLTVALAAGCGGGGQDSNSGNAVASDLPRVSGTINANGATNVAVNTKVGATFSEGMNPSTISSATLFLMQGATLVPGTVSYSGVNAVIAPASSLAPRTVYTVTVKGGADGVKDLAGNAMVRDALWAWTTGTSSDTFAPTVSSTVNANGAVNVPINTRLGATFSEGMDPLTITNVNCSVTETLSGASAVAATVSYSGVSLEFILDQFGPTPQYLLFPNTSYTVRLKGGVGGVEDLAGNPMANDYVWTFTTGPAML